MFFLISRHTYFLELVELIGWIISVKTQGQKVNDLPNSTFMF